MTMKMRYPHNTAFLDGYWCSRRIHLVTGSYIVHHPPYEQLTEDAWCAVSRRHMAVKNWQHGIEKNHSHRIVKVGYYIIISLLYHLIMHCIVIVIFNKVLVLYPV